MRTTNIALLDEVKDRNTERKRNLSGTPGPQIEAHEDVDLLAAALEAVLTVLAERDKWARVILDLAQTTKDKERASILAADANHRLDDSRQIVEAMEDKLGRSRRSVEISVPSGRLIAADDLRSVQLFNIETPYDHRGSMDLDLLTESQARETNAVYAFVGNSCPSVLRKKDGSLEVVSPEYGDEDEPLLHEGEVPVADICTDLWATMMTDYQHWLDQGGSPVQPDGGKFTVIDVPAGRYRWTPFSHVPGFDIDATGRITYARFELIEAY